MFANVIKLFKNPSEEHEANVIRYKQVAKAAEEVTAAMVAFPFNTVVNVLIPYVQTSRYPMIDAAIRMLTILVKSHPNEITDEHLAGILAGLLKVNLTTTSITLIRNIHQYNFFEELFYNIISMISYISNEA